MKPFSVSVSQDPLGNDSMVGCFVQKSTFTPWIASWNDRDIHNSTTVDGGRNPANSPVEVGSFSHYLQGFIHVGWCRISCINSIKLFFLALFAMT